MATSANQQPKRVAAFSAPKKTSDAARDNARLVQILADVQTAHLAELQQARETTKHKFISHMRKITGAL